MRWILRISMLVTICFAMAAVGEITLRFRERHRTTPPDAWPMIHYPHLRLASGMIPNTDYYGWFQINSQGFRGREFSEGKEPGVFRIACLGGSTTFDIGSVGEDRPWPEILEAELRERLPDRRIEVLNFGVGGYTTLDSMVNLQLNVLRYDPDLIIVYHGHNDLRFSTLGGQVADGLFPMERAPRGRLERWLQHNSILYSKGKLKIRHLLRRVKTDKQTPELASFETLLIEGVKTYESNLTSILAICRAFDIPVLLPKLVLEYRHDLPPRDRAEAGERLSRAFRGMEVEDILAAYAMFNETIDKVANRYAAHVVETPEFVAGGPRNFHDLMHFDGPGSSAMGIGLAKALAPLIASKMRDADAESTRLP